ncbi:MAG: hypothetical protein R2718_13340 [Solirubrobacterales bacterium]|nr:hypothetical protein [Solirubrobacterales bacterium]
MTSATLISPPPATRAERRRGAELDRTVREARRRSRRGPRKRPRGTLGGSPPGAGGRLLQL